MLVNEQHPAADQRDAGQLRPAGLQRDLPGDPDEDRRHETGVVRHYRGQARSGNNTVARRSPEDSGWLRRTSLTTD